MAPALLQAEFAVRPPGARACAARSERRQTRKCRLSLCIACVLCSRPWGLGAGELGAGLAQHGAVWVGL